MCSTDGNTFTLKGVEYHDEGTAAYNGEMKDGVPQGWWVENCDFKIKLRHYTDLTLQEKMSLDPIVLINRNPKMNPNELTAYQVQLLMAWGIDMFGLIEAGLAIPKTIF